MRYFLFTFITRGILVKNEEKTIKETNKSEKKTDISCGSSLDEW